MALINHATRELTAKIVYYGPGLCGKTTNLKFIYESLDEELRGPMLSLSTESDRTLFFDFLPLDLGEVKGFRVRVQLYTVPGQVFYEETRRRVLKGADGVVFVADSQRSLQDANRDSFAQLLGHLRDNGLDPAELPLVLQYNKRDLPGLLSVEELDRDLNPGSVPFFEAVASVGIGVEDTFRAISRLVLKRLVSFDQEREAPSRLAAGAEESFPASSAPSAEELFEADAEEALVLEGEADPQPLFGDSATDERALLDSDPFLSEAVPQELEPAAALFSPPEENEAIDPIGAEAEAIPASLPKPELPGVAAAVPGVPLELHLEIEGKRYRLKILLEPE